MEISSKKYEELKKQITSSLKVNALTGETLESGDVRIFLTRNRSLKSENPSQTIHKPYPKVEGDLTNDYDSWLS